MGMSVSTTMGFENREFINNSGKNNAQSNGTVAEKAVDVIVPSYNTTNYKPLTTQQYILLASTQITVNNSLKETLKYLRNHENNKKKEYILGDLWKIMNTENEASEKNPYNGELLDFDIESKKNIFAA